VTAARTRTGTALADAKLLRVIETLPRDLRNAAHGWLSDAAVARQAGQLHPDAVCKTVIRRMRRAVRGLDDERARVELGLEVDRLCTELLDINSHNGAMTALHRAFDGDRAFGQADPDTAFQLVLREADELGARRVAELAARRAQARLALAAPPPPPLPQRVPQRQLQLLARAVAETGQFDRVEVG